MKTAISLPDELFHQIDARAKALKLSRSALLARAAREFLASDLTKDATEAWNRAIEGGQPGDEPAAVLARKRTKAVVRATSARRSSARKKKHP